MRAERLSPGNGRSEPDELCGSDGRNRLEPLQDLVRYRFVDFDQAEREAADAIAAELEPRNIDVRLPEHGADRAHHARHVAIMQHQEAALRDRLDAVAVDPDKPQRAI